MGLADVGPVSNLQPIIGSTPAAWLAVGGGDLTRVDVTGAVARLPRPPGEGAVSGAEVIGHHVFTIGDTSGSLLHLDTEVEPLAWAAVSVDGRPMEPAALATDPTGGRLVVVEADGRVHATGGDPTVWTTVAEPVRFPGQLEDHEDLAVHILGDDVLAVLTRPAREGWSRPVWFVRRIRP